MPRERCSYCGTVTGEHGFSWEKDGRFRIKEAEEVEVEEDAGLHAASIGESYTD